MPVASNRLALEKSPYLLQHAHNPVDWFPWGNEAFAKARAEDKPIFLSVGYSTCHWCHVMEHESFESAAIAAFLTEHFVSIKVDREERPDVDQVYMTFIQATTGQGGWPMSVWLTPDLRPFVGGTYFPPTDMPGRPGFITILRRIAELWKSDRARIEEKAASLLAALRETEREIGGDAADCGVTWNPAPVLRQALAYYLRIFDANEAGFGGAPKFPRPVNLQFLLHLAAGKGEPQKDAEIAGGMALQTLRKMAGGGMHDHLGGGFHRYSVDAAWHVPHFEKMLYDQAQLAAVYLTARQLSGETVFGEVARNVLQYVAHDLTSGEGGFFSAEDADSLPTEGASKKSEGAFYVWSHAEVAEVLGRDRLEEFCAVYGVEAAGNVPPDADPHGELEGMNILIQRMSGDDATALHGRMPEEMGRRLREDKSALLAKRGLRPRPHLDDKILTAWNGLMIGAFARGAQVIGETSFLRTAQQAASFVRKNLFDPGSGELSRSFRGGPSAIGGFAADYAFLINGLLDLYAADFDPEWLTWARQLQDTLDLHFWDQTDGGYYSTTDRDPSLLLRVKEDYDGAEPTPTSVAAHNLWRLGQLFHNDVLIDHARHAIPAFASRMEAQPIGLPLLLSAAALLEMAPIHLVIHSPDRAHPGLAAMLIEARRRYLPPLIVIQIADTSARDFFSSHHLVIENLPAVCVEPTAYLCENYVCQLPVTKPEALRKMIDEL